MARNLQQDMDMYDDEEVYIYGKLNKIVEKVEYEGLETETISVEVDNNNRTISANIKDGVIPQEKEYYGGTTETAQVSISDENVITVDVVGEPSSFDLYNNCITIYYDEDSISASLRLPIISNVILPNAIEVEEYSSLEKIAREIYSKYRVANASGVLQNYGYVQAFGFTYFSDSSKYYQVIGLKALYSNGDYSLYAIYIDDDPNFSPMQERLLEDELVNSIGIAPTKY